MSGHKNKGFSQTSKAYDGDLKAQHQKSRSHQVDHSAEEHGDDVATSSKDVKPSDLKKGGRK